MIDYHSDHWNANFIGEYHGNQDIPKAFEI